MASTLSPQRAFNYAKSFIKNMNLEEAGASILDDINKYMWMAAPWRWTIGSMPTATLASNTQDYSISVPGDFLYLVDAYLADGSTVTRPLRIEPALPAAVGIKGQPGRVAISSTNFRLSPIPGNQPNAPPVLISLYKKQSPSITKQNMATAGVQVFDDEWFWVFQEGVLWRAYLYGDDQRAGSATVTNDGKVQFTGQRAVFEAGLQLMRQNEKLPLFDTERDQRQ